MGKSVVLSRITLIVVFTLIIITQGIVVHAGQEMMQETKWAQFPGMISVDLLKHYP
jgi:hypothetical protein